MICLMSSFFVQVEKSAKATYEKGFNFDDPRLLRGAWRNEPNPDTCKVSLLYLSVNRCYIHTSLTMNFCTYDKSSKLIFPVSQFSMQYVLFWLLYPEFPLLFYIFLYVYEWNCISNFGNWKMKQLPLCFKIFLFFGFNSYGYHIVPLISSPMFQLYFLLGNGRWIYEYQKMYRG